MPRLTRGGARLHFWSLLILAVALLVASCTARAQTISSAYDSHFETYSEMYLPMWDWRWLKAQCYQESLLRPQAVSPVGARGLCQFMPGTWRDAQAALGLSAPPENPIASIHASAWYMARLRRSWSAPRPEADRRELAQASYNAGLGNILRAQRACGNPALYEPIIACLPSITGQRNAHETTTYTQRIRRWYALLVATD